MAKDTFMVEFLPVFDSFCAELVGRIEKPEKAHGSFGKAAATHAQDAPLKKVLFSLMGLPLAILRREDFDALVPRAPELQAAQKALYLKIKEYDAKFIADDMRYRLNLVRAADEAANVAAPEEYATVEGRILDYISASALLANLNFNKGLTREARATAKYDLKRRILDDKFVLNLGLLRSAGSRKRVTDVEIAAAKEELTARFKSDKARLLAIKNGEKRQNAPEMGAALWEKINKANHNVLKAASPQFALEEVAENYLPAAVAAEQSLLESKHLPDITCQFLVVAVTAIEEFIKMSAKYNKELPRLHTLATNTMGGLLKKKSIHLEEMLGHAKEVLEICRNPNKETARRWAAAAATAKRMPSSSGGGGGAPAPLNYARLAALAAPPKRGGNRKTRRLLARRQTKRRHH